MAIRPLYLPVSWVITLHSSSMAGKRHKLFVQNFTFQRLASCRCPRSELSGNHKGHDVWWNPLMQIWSMDFVHLDLKRRKKNSKQQFICILFHEDDWHTGLSNKISTCKSSLTHHIRINIYYLQATAIKFKHEDDESNLESATSAVHGTKVCL